MRRARFVALSGSVSKPKAPDLVAKAKEALLNCVKSCGGTIDYYTSEKNQFPDPSLRGLLKRCRETCGAAYKELEGGSEINYQKIEQCAKACAKCADLCERFPNEQVLIDCGEACRTAETACGELVSAH